MPYIPTNRRPVFDDSIKQLIDNIENMGEFNYIISCIANGLIRKLKISYKVLNGIIGVLECAKLEQYRRVVSPYETAKIIENGDIE